jgi:hypothetical protein
MLSRVIKIVVAPNKPYLRFVELYMYLSIISRESPDDNYSAIFTTTFP